MNDRVLQCLVDTLLPGDNGEPPLPCASDVGVDRVISARMAADDGSALRRAVAAVVRAAAGAHEFVRSSGGIRAAAIARAEQGAPADVRSLVVLALETYYQSERVILALGWRPQSPQPLGHTVEPLDLSLLDQVRGRAPMWTGDPAGGSAA